MASSSSYLHPMSGTSPSYLHMASSTYLHNMAPPGTKQWTTVGSSQQQQMTSSTTNKQQQQQHSSQQSSQLQQLDGLTNHLSQNSLTNNLIPSTSQTQLEKNFELQQEDFPPLPKSATISQNQESTSTISSQQTSNNLLPSVSSSSSSSQHPFNNYSATSSNSLNGFTSLNDLKQLQQLQTSSSPYHHTSSSPSPTIFKSSVDQMNTLLNRQQSIPASQSTSLSNSQHPQYIKQLSQQPSGSGSSTSNSSSSTSVGFAALLAAHQAHASQQQQQQQNLSNTNSTSGQTTTSVIGSNGTVTAISGQTSNGGNVTIGNTLPSSTITDQYGLVGLLQIIQQAEKDPIASTLLNCDLTTLGLSMESSTDLYPSFISPFVDQQARPHEIDYQVPYEYQMGMQIRDKLPQVKFDQLNEDTLFFLFYLFGNDYIQISAANELYRRDWRYHKDERIWLT
ncbi:unnamed protein product, partial [Didymodactylos carnosus]